MREFFGKYRGKVENNVDPNEQGRIQVSVPSVLGEGRLAWAMPCVPYAGPGVGFFAIPPLRANVWVEFECGAPDYPIWSGCFWGRGEAPRPDPKKPPPLPPMKVIKTDGVTLIFNDTPGAGGFTLEVGPPAVSTPLKLVFSASGIEIDNGQKASLKLTGPQVSVNNGALEVT